jgi:hypothetical protein
MTAYEAIEKSLHNICNCIEIMTTSFLIGVNEAAAADKIPICCGHTPQSAPPKHITILETAGGDVEGQLPYLADFHIQIISRAETHFEARDLIWEVYKALHGCQCDSILYEESAGAGESFVTIDATTTPMSIGQDDKGRFQFSCNFIWSYRKKY